MNWKYSPELAISCVVGSLHVAYVTPINFFKHRARSLKWPNPIDLGTYNKSNPLQIGIYAHPVIGSFVSFLFNAGAVCV